MRVINKTKKQQDEYNLLLKKLSFISNWKCRYACELKTATKHFYLGGVTKKEKGLIQLFHHYNKKYDRIMKLMKHV